MIIGVIAVVMVACDKDESTSEIIKSSTNVQPILKEELNKTDMNQLDWCWNSFTEELEICCNPIDENCLPIVIIIGSAIELTADYNEFLDAIDNNTINSFFLTESNYSTLFPLLTEPDQASILSSLQTQSIHFVVEYNASEDVTCYLAIPTTVNSSSYTTGDVIAAFRFDVE